MARPIWNGTLSFGLLNVPVSLMSGERNNAAVRYERVNAETGEEVPWKDIVKAFEYDKGSYVVLETEDIKSAAPESHDAIEVESFVDAGAIGPQYFEKPYVLVPAKKAEKGYVLLRETLARTGKIGIARVVIRTRESLCAVIPQGDALLLLMMRYPQELVDVADYNLPAGDAADYRVNAKELQMAEQLIDSMSGAWKPDDYKDEFRDRLQAIIRKRIKSAGGTTQVEEEADGPEEATTNVVDFMALLQQSLDAKTRTPAKKAGAAAGKTGAKAAGAKKAPAKKAAKKAPAKKAAKKTPARRKTG